MAKRNGDKETAGNTKKTVQHGLKHAMKNTPQYHLSHGRPKKIETPELMALMIDTYLDRCYQNEMMPMFSDLLLELDVTKQTWEKYKKDDAYSHLCLRAELIVEKYLELQSRYGFNPTSPNFFLERKFGYTRTTENIVTNETYEQRLKRIKEAAEKEKEKRRLKAVSQPDNSVKERLRLCVK